MVKIIACANQKGGVGKTTTSINLSASLVATKRKVLLVDLDPQGNATMGSGIDKNEVEYTANSVLLQEVGIEKAILPSESGGYDVLPANGELSATDFALMQTRDREHRLSLALNNIKACYDYIIIDCPPSLNMVTINGLVAATSILITMQCEYYALEGLSGLLEVIEKIKERLNPTLAIEGVLRTMYDSRNRLSQDVTDQLQQYFGEKLFSTVIPRNVRLAEAPSFGMPALKYDAKSVGAQAYLALAGELLRRHEAEEHQAVEEEELSEA